MVGIRKALRKLDDNFSLDDVGSTLLEDLAKGLYQPHEVIREYVQNAVDAHRIQASETGMPVKQPIQIEVRGNKLTILDWGSGMDDKEIRKVKSIAVSRKRNADVELTGHKGVGIWAGLSFFRTLKLYTTKQGSNEAYELTLKFDSIVDSIGPEVSIGKALNPNYSIEVFQADPEEHFTDVTLEDPIRASEFFLDSKKVMNAVRHFCPCELDDNFWLFDRVTQWYEDHSLEFFPIEVNGVPVYRSYSSYVEKFEMGTITVNDTPVARYWKAIHKKNKVISPSEGQLVGFRLIQNGFVLGDANPYTSVAGLEDLKLQDFLSWYVGEIHLISHELRPDLKRDQLEESEATRQFIGRLRELYRTAEQDARTLSGVRNILKRYAEIQQVVDEAEKASAPPLILSQAYERTLKDKLDELKEEDEKVHKSKGKQSPDPKLRALRDVRPQRKKLRSEIEKLLPGDITLFESNDVSGTVDEASLQKLRDPGTSEQSGDDEERNDGLAKTATNVAGMDKQASVLSVDIVLGLLNEVLTEELSDSPEKRSAIISKLEKRVSEVMADV